MGPARERLGADDPPRLEFDLGLISDPDLTAVDGRIELAEHRQLPGRVLEAVGIVELPLEPIVRALASRLASDRLLPISTPKATVRSIGSLAMRAGLRNSE